MNPTLEQSKTALAIIDAELALLKNKVASGQCLRVGERRHLLTFLPARVDVREVARYALAMAAKEWNSLRLPGQFENRIDHWIEQTAQVFDDGGAQ